MLPGAFVFIKHRLLFQTDVARCTHARYTINTQTKNGILDNRNVHTTVGLIFDNFHKFSLHYLCKFMNKYRDIKIIKSESDANISQSTVCLFIHIAIP